MRVPPSCPLSDDENLTVLERLVDHFEQPLPEPFRMRRDELNVEHAGRIVRGTVGFRRRVARFVSALERPGPYQNPRLASWMRDLHGCGAS